MITCPPLCGAGREPVMSTLRVLCVSRLAAASRRALSNRSPRGLQAFRRCQSTKPAKSGFRAGRFVAYTVTTTGLVVGGAVAYANYDPVFKNQVDKVVPGFAQLADRAADLFVDRVRPTPHPHVGRTGGGGGGGGLDSGNIGRATGRRVDQSVSGNQLSQPQEPVPVNADPVQSSAESVHVHSDTKSEEELLTASVETTDTLKQHKEGEGEGETVVDVVAHREGWEAGEDVREEELRGRDLKEEMESTGESVAEREMGKKVEGVKGDVERVVEEVRGEVERVAGEARDEKVREVQEMQMADQQLSWLKDSAQVEKKLEQTLQEFISETTKVEQAQITVSTNSQEYSRLVKEITSDRGEDTQSVYDTADAVKRAEEAVQASRDALKSAVESHKSLSQNLSELMDRAVELGLKSKVEEMEERVRECVDRLAEGSVAMQQADVERQLLQEYQSQAQQDREQLQRELGQELPEGDSRQEAVLVMLGRRIEVLKDKLQGVENEHQERLAEALDKQKASLEKLAERRLEWRLRDKEREMQQELSYRAGKIHREYQSELREQLKRQTDSHNQLLSDALSTQAEQLARKWSGELELKLRDQESHYQRELALTSSRLRGIEYMVNTIAAAGNETKRQQGMRAACDSLHAALKSVSACLDPDERHSLQREVNILRDAAKDDPFVLVMLDSLPGPAVSRIGIQGEGGLKERFTKVKRICRRVALVPERGGGMGTYALSYLQSMLVVSWRFVGRIAREVGEDGDLQKLDTFDILERADVCLRQGDMDLAVRYVNLLCGEPRMVARDWLCDARCYLETSQAVRLVSEYMAALNITLSSPAATPQTD